jgi:hypothetical protein
VDPGAGLDGCGKSRPLRDSIPGPSSPWRFAVSTELQTTLQLFWGKFCVTILLIVHVMSFKHSWETPYGKNSKFYLR